MGGVIVLVSVERGIKCCVITTRGTKEQYLCMVEQESGIGSDKE